MPSACFIDTNVFLYAKDPQTPVKRARAVAWIEVLAEKNEIVISPQVLNEFAYNVIRKLRHIGQDALRQNIEAMLPWCTAPLVGATTVAALAIRRRFNLSFYDSVLVASAIAGQCTVFLSEDLGDRQRLGQLTVVNPFNVDPDAFTVTV
jgi:predicted nucleic acid-binding protein